MESSNATQLADKYPQIDTALRIDPPLSMNIPERIESQPKEFFVSKNAFSPAAFTQRRNIFENTTDLGGGGQSLLNKSMVGGSKSPSKKSNSASNNVHFQTLANAAKRCGNLEMESVSLLSMAILFDNQVLKK